MKEVRNTFFFCKEACYFFLLIVLYLKIFREGKLKDLNRGRSWSEEVDANNDQNELIKRDF